MCYNSSNTYTRRFGCCTTPVGQPDAANAAQCAEDLRQHSTTCFQVACKDAANHITAKIHPETVAAFYASSHAKLRFHCHMCMHIMAAAASSIQQLAHLGSTSSAALMSLHQTQQSKTSQKLTACSSENHSSSSSSSSSAREMLQL
jgi:hypothetical protein